MDGLSLFGERQGARQKVFTANLPLELTKTFRHYAVVVNLVDRTVHAYLDGRCVGGGILTAPLSPFPTWP